MKKPRTTFEHGVELLASRERSAQALTSALVRAGHAADDVEAALLRLQALGYLDDRRVARARAGEALAGRAKAGAVAKLVAQGLDEAVAFEAVDAKSVDEGSSDEDRARAYLVKRGLDGARAARALAARGFDEELIRRLVPGLSVE